MTLWDPFFGVFDVGKTIARWLNRLLIVVEISVIILGFKYHCDEVWLRNELIWRILYFPGCLVAVNILNRAIRTIWNILLVFVFGSSNPEDIFARHEHRRELREIRNENKALKRERAKQIHQEKVRKRLEKNKKELDYFMNSSPLEFVSRGIGRKFLFRIFSNF